MTTLNNATSVTINSVMDIFLSVLQNFPDTAVFKTISKKPSSFGKCMYLKLTFFLYHNLILFSERIIDQAQMFSQNHSFVLHTIGISCNLTLRNHWTWTFPKLGITLWYIGLGLKNIWTTLLDSYWFYDILEFDLKCY